MTSQVSELDRSQLYDLLRADLGPERPGLLQAVWASRWLTLLIVGATTLGLALISALTATGVTARTQVGLVDRGSIPGSSSALPGDVQSRYLSDQAAFVTSEEVMRRAVSVLPGLTPATLRDHVAVTPDLSSNTIAVSAAGASSREALARVDAVVVAFRQESRRQFQQQAAATNAALEAARSTITSGTPGSGANDQALANLYNRSVDVRVQAQTFGDGVRFSNPAEVVKLGLLGKPATRGGLVGLALGVVIASALALHRADPRRRSAL